jgi:hypothetical protein
VRRPIEGRTDLTVGFAADPKQPALDQTRQSEQDADTVNRGPSINVPAATSTTLFNGAVPPGGASFVGRHARRERISRQTNKITIAPMVADTSVRKKPNT